MQKGSLSFSLPAEFRAKYIRQDYVKHLEHCNLILSIKTTHLWHCILGFRRIRQFGNHTRCRYVSPSKFEMGSYTTLHLYSI